MEAIDVPGDAPAEGSAVRDKTRVLLPGLVALVAVAATLVVGPSSASRQVSVATAGPARHVASALVPTQASRSPAPELGIARSAKFSVPVALLASRAPAVAPLGKLRPADLFVVAPVALPSRTLTAVRRLSGVTAAQSLDAARVRVNGRLTAMLGVDPSQFRSFAAKPTASSDRLWQSVASGGIAVSYTMGRLDRLPLGGKVAVAGARQQRLRVGGFGTVGVTGVDAVVSHSVAASLGFPAGNAIVVSAPHAGLSSLAKQIRRLIPRGAVVEPLVSQVNASGKAGAAGVTSSVSGVTSRVGSPVSRAFRGYPTVSSTQLAAMISAALSRQGKPYVWGGSGPSVFDCSGLVQWSFAQAGIVMPRVAADQALTGPAVPLSQAAAGDLLFYHTDPTAPNYISHVAIYLGHGLMEQAPEPGMNVQVVPVALGAGFAGVVRVDPQIAASVAGSAG
jgi:cell wall-associated NlpC family hydrolase